MLTILYPAGYLLSLLGLIAWFYYQDNPQRSRVMSKLFLGGFFVYLFSLAFADGEVGYKLLILFRDLIILGLTSQFFNFFRKNKLLFVAMLAILLGAFKFFGYQKMVQTFPQPNRQVAPTTTETITEAPTPPSPLAVDGELLVEISENHQIAELQQIVDKYNLSYELAFHPADPISTDLDDYFVVNVPDRLESEIDEIINALIETGLVDHVEDNEVIKLDPMEQSPVPGSSRDFGINDPGVKQLWGFDKMNVDKLYATLSKAKITPKKKALIAILDTGIDAKHEDIKDNYLSTKSNYDNDPQSHGTHCAGIAAAVSNNGVGVASFSKNNKLVQVTSIKVLSPFGGGTQRTIINGMIEAADRGADVISMSLGGRSNDSRQRAYEKAVKYCNEKGAIVVVAAGNSNMDAKGYAPANTDGVITVSALDSELKRAHFSNHVANLKMGIAAPGVGIYSTIPGDKYASYNGTSMATPYVAGLVGLMKSIYPKLTTAEAYMLMNKNGMETGQTKQTGKLIQPEKTIVELLD